MRRTVTDPKLLGSVLVGPSWEAWRVLLIAAMGEALTDDERKTFTELTGREREPLQRVRDVFEFFSNLFSCSLSRTRTQNPVSGSAGKRD